VKTIMSTKYIPADITFPINAVDIMQYMPHRYPFFLLDRIDSYEKGKSLKARKNVTINEPFFTGHFPDYPVMPGVLIVEAMAQAAGVLSVLISGVRKDSEIYFFAGITNAKFRRQVIPGDTLILDIKLTKEMRGVGKYAAIAYVDGTIACSAELTIAKKEV
jgi:3-hydroxyacyl-[acyl-carrier-protein] dehydratase